MPIESRIAKLLVPLITIPAVAFAQDKSTSTIIEALVLLAILIIMAGLPLYRKMKV